MKYQSTRHYKGKMIVTSKICRRYQLHSALLNQHRLSCVVKLNAEGCCIHCRWDRWLCTQNEFLSRSHWFLGVRDALLLLGNHIISYQSLLCAHWRKLVAERNYRSTLLRYLYFAWVFLLYTSTPLHFKGTYCTFFLNCIVMYLFNK